MQITILDQIGVVEDVRLSGATLRSWRGGAY
jgi:hypothetical protein